MDANTEIVLDRFKNLRTAYGPETFREAILEAFCYFEDVGDAVEDILLSGGWRAPE